MVHPTTLALICNIAHMYTLFLVVLSEQSIEQEQDLERFVNISSYNLVIIRCYCLSIIASAEHSKVLISFVFSPL
jgi:hypothetical protein